MPDIYIDINELASLKGITTRAVRLAISKGKYTAREILVQGGKSYEVLLSSLEKDIQEKYLEKQTDATVLNLEQYPIEIPEKAFLPDRAKQVALARLDLIKEWRKFRNNHHRKTLADKEFLDSYNSGLFYEKIFETIGSVSIGTLQRWSRTVGFSTDYMLLTPSYSYSKQNEFRTSLSEQEKNIFMKLLLHPHKFSVGKAISITKHVLEKQGQEYIPSDITFRRYAKWFRNNNYDKWIFAREGSKALNDKVSPYIIRDASLLTVGDVLVADGHRLAFQILNPFTGKPSRAILIGFLDWKSGYLCGYEVMLEEDIQAIASALRNSILHLKQVPRIVYQDNGKAFKAKYFTNTDFRESGFTGIYGRLGIKTVFAKPYNAKAKVIERFFLEFQESFEKLIPTYSGSSIIEKPARLKRNEKLHKELHEKITGGYIPTIAEVKQLLDAWLEFKHSQICPNDKTRTIKEVFEEREKHNINVKELDDLMMAQEIKTIYRNGIRFLSTFYFSDALYGLKDKVIMKYSLFDLSYIRIYTIKGEYLCTAKRVESTHPMAYHMGDVKDMQDFKQKIQKQKKLRNRTLNTIKKYIPKEDIKFLETQMIQEVKEQTESIENKIIEKPTQINPETKPLFINTYERYEWLINNGCKNQEERQWLEMYIKSEEYKEIYE